MKFKFILAAAIASVIFGAAASAAEITGTVLTTDIGTVIDGAPIRSYNVNDSTYVIAEDLRGYGFDVAYSDSNRTLYIEQNVYAERTLLPADEVNIKKEDITVDQWQADIYSSDITVQLNGVPIEAYALDGQMIIPVRALESCAYVEFSETRRVARVYGLKWYMEQLYLNGEAEMEVLEYTDRTYSAKDTTVHSESQVSVTEITASTDNGGTISLYIGNPVYEYHPSQYHYGWQVAREEYVITDEYGKETYRLHLCSENLIGDSYARVSTRAQTYSEPTRDYLYGIEVELDKACSDYWPSDEEVAVSDMTVAEIGMFNSKMCVITNGGYLLKLSTADERTLLRYNVKSIPYSGYIIANDDTLYKSSSILSDTPSISSAFDEKIAENVRKYTSWGMVSTDGIFYDYNNKQLFENAVDFDTRTSSGERYYAVIADTGELYLGTREDYQNGTAGVIANNAKDICFDYWEVYYITDSNELYSYSLKNWSSEKLADNIAEIVTLGYYITADGALTDLSEIYVEKVTSAYVTSNYLYAAHTDGTVYRYDKDDLTAVRMYY